MAEMLDFHIKVPAGYQGTTLELSVNERGIYVTMDSGEGVLCTYVRGEEATRLAKWVNQAVAAVDGAGE